MLFCCIYPSLKSIVSQTKLQNLHKPRPKSMHQRFVIDDHYRELTPGAARCRVDQKDPKSSIKGEEGVERGKRRNMQDGIITGASSSC